MPKYIDFSRGLGGHTKLEGANKLRWALVGQLKRTAALINSMANQYPSAAGALYRACEALNLEAASINNQYATYKKAYRAKQQELKGGTEDGSPAK